MIKILLSIAALSTTASAVVLTGSDSLLFGEFFPNDPSLAGEYGIDFSFIDNPEINSLSWIFQASDIDTFQSTNFTVGSLFTFYESSFGALATQNTPPTGAVIGTNGGATSPFDIAVGESAFFAFEFATDLSSSPTLNYGWIELENNGGILSDVGSAIASDEPGIVVGTTRVIPEPSTSLLFFAASLFFLKRRR